MYIHNVHIQKEKTVNIRADIETSSASVHRVRLSLCDPTRGSAAVFDERARPTGQVTSSPAHGTGWGSVLRLRFLVVHQLKPLVYHIFDVTTNHTCQFVCRKPGAESPNISSIKTVLL